MNETKQAPQRPERSTTALTEMNATETLAFAELVYIGELLEHIAGIPHQERTGIVW